MMSERHSPSTGACLLAVAACILAAGCGSDGGTVTPIAPVDHSLHASRTGQGTLTSAPAGIALSASTQNGTASYVEGTEVTLTATPASGWQVAGWGGACSGSGTGSSCEVTMSQDRTVSVTFEEVPPAEYTLGASLAGQGTLTSAPAGIALSASTQNGTASYVEGTEVTLTATPATGWQVAGWGGACSGSEAGSSCAVTMSEDRTVSVTFEEEAAPGTVTILSDSLPQSFEGFPLGITLEAESDPPGATVTWSLGGGTLPAGVTLSTIGELEGAPSETGTFSPQFVAEVGGGASDSVVLSLEVCPGAVDLAPGGSVVLESPSSCGILLSDEAGREYTVGIMPRSEVTVGLNLVSLSGGVRLGLRAGAPGAFAEPVTTPMAVVAGPDRRTAAGELLPDPEFPNTEAFHHELREQEVREFESLLGPVTLEPAVAFAGPAAVPEPEMDFFVRFEGGVHSITAELRGVSDQVLFYQDEVSVAEDAVSQSDIDAMLAYYDTYGHAVIDQAFGGLGPDGTITNVFQESDGTPLSVSARDIDGNGRLIVLYVRRSLFPAGVAGYVSSCDRFPRPGNRQPGSPLGICAGSNQAEITYMRSLSAHTLVHEVKHISSHGWAAYGPRGFNQSWIEEGTAEIAKEIAARVARGYGPDQTAGAEFWDGTIGAQGMNQLISRANSWLAVQPDNPLFGRSATNRWGFYGASWLYHRYLADTFGRTYFASDADFFRFMNTGHTSRGAIQAATQTSVEATLPGFLSAIATGGSLGTAGDLIGYDFHSFGSVSGSWANWPKPVFELEFASADLDWVPRHSATLFGRIENASGTHLLLNLSRTDGEPLNPADLVVLTVTRVP